MQTISRDGNFTMSAPDFAKTGCRLLRAGESEETKFDKIMDVYLEAINGKEVSLYDVAHTVEMDCFSTDGAGLLLLAKMLKCHLTVVENKYEFTVDWQSSFDSYLEIIADQFKL